MIKIIEYILNVIGKRKLQDMLEDLNTIEYSGITIIKSGDWIANLIKTPKILYIILIVTLIILILVGIIYSHIYNKPYSTYKRRKEKK